RSTCASPRLAAAPAGSWFHRIDLAPAMAPDEPSRIRVLQHRRGHVAEAGKLVRTTRMERATFREIDQVRNVAGYRLDLAARGTELHARAHQGPGVGHPGSKEEIRERTLLHDLAGIHDQDARGELANEPEIV